MKNKLELIKEMVKLGVTKITLPPRDVKGCKRPTPLKIDLAGTYEATLPNHPDDKQGHTSNETERETHKYFYADRAKSDGSIPGMAELKELLIKEINEKHPELLQCDMQKELTKENYTWIWTPAYCPWLQPIEVRSSPGGPCCLHSLKLFCCAKTFWAVGKGHAARKNRNKRTMRQCITHLREGWYGCAEYHKWVAAGSPLVEHGKPISQAARTPAAQKRFQVKGGPKKSAVDWIPSNCHRPVNCDGLMRVMMKEADRMVTNLPGLSGSISGVTADDNTLVCDFDVWTPVESHTRDMSDLTGVDTSQLVGNDTILREGSGGITIRTEHRDGDLPLGTTAEPGEGAVCVRCGDESVGVAEELCEACFAAVTDGQAVHSDMEESGEEVESD